MLYTMQADSMSRFFAMTITDNGAPWTAPDGAAWTVRFGAPGMPAGWYDTITETGDGTHPAVVVDENTVTVEIAEQAVSAPGQNILCVLVTDAQGYQIASWPFVLSVQGVPGFDAPEATVYYNALTAQVAQALANAQAAAGSATQAAGSATLSQSWAVGGTGTREGEDINNAEYWAGQAEAAAGSAVASFNGRTGAVMPQAGDYTAEMVGAVATFNGRTGAVMPQSGDYTPEMVGALPAAGFSTGEVATGQTWIDGKPLFKRTFEIDLQSDPFSFDTGITAGTLDTVFIGAESFCVYVDSSARGAQTIYPASSVYSSNETYNTLFFVKPDYTATVTIDWRGGTGWNGQKAYITLYYTKAEA